MGYIGQTPSAVPLTSADIADGTITNDDLAGSITDAKISALAASKLTGQAGVAQGGTGAATHTANNVLIGNGTSAITSVAPSTSGNVLTSNGSAWASTAPAGGGGWTLIGSATASSSASLTVTGLTGLPAMIIGVDLHPVDNQVYPYLRMGDSSGIDSGSTDYFWHCSGEEINGDQSGSSVSGKKDWEASQIEISHISSTDGETGNTSDCGVSFEGKMYNGRGAEMIPGWQGATLCRDSDTVLWDMRWGGARKSKITTDRVQFLFSSGNIASGSIYVYELAIT
jgi:hypothetical protein